jgi:hypothetical protein
LRCTSRASERISYRPTWKNLHLKNCYIISKNVILMAYCQCDEMFRFCKIWQTRGNKKMVCVKLLNKHNCKKYLRPFRCRPGLFVVIKFDWKVNKTFLWKIF